MMGRAFPLGVRLEDAKPGVQRIAVVWDEAPAEFALQPVQRDDVHSEKPRSPLRVMPSAGAQSLSPRPQAPAKKAAARAGGMQVARRAGATRPTTAHQLVNAPTDG
jgi:hypothetical protein